MSWVPGLWHGTLWNQGLSGDVVKVLGNLVRILLAFSESKAIDHVP